MKKVLALLTIALAFVSGTAFQSQNEIVAQTKKVYELRTYTTAAGRPVGEA